MDNENFENIDLPISEEMKNSVVEGGTVEYWDIEDEKIIKKVM